MIYGILVCYYEKYKEKAVHDFIYLLSGLNNDFRLIIVNNSSKLSSYEKVKDKIFEISGSNLGWEFSAWDEGVHFVNKNFGDTDDDFFVFANDTFNHHRVFNFLDTYYFRKAILRLMIKKNPVLVGEINSIGEMFKVNDDTANSWISSYLFAMNRQLLDFSGSFNMTDDVFSSLLMDITNKKITFSDKVSANLATHLNGWLFPKQNKKHQWYGSKHADLQLLSYKLKAILNEKKISINLFKCKGEMIGVYGRIDAWLYLKARNFIYRRLHR